MKINKKFGAGLLIIIIIISIIIYFIINSNENLNDDSMIKYSGETIFYIPDFNYLKFNEVKNDIKYILIIPNCISDDVSNVKKILKLEDNEKIKLCSSLFTLDNKKEFNKDEVIDFTVNHTAVFFRINDGHYFRIDIFDDYYSVEQDNISASIKYYSYDHTNKVAVMNIINDLVK